MKLYYFNPNDYGQEYMVCSHSKRDALNSLKEHLKKMSDEDEGYYWGGEYIRWKNATIYDLPQRYTIDEYEEGQVLDSEIS